jgi:alkanesulfonate monooxygenase SsuD/methylene tetrahydromethanopterin reductase-like flavin-dependent oxidoreductase (luciferase family)
MAGLAAMTRKIRFGQLVLCNSFRNPALLAKIGATLDVISSGRFELGIGAGWHMKEYEAYGYSFPRYETRLEQLSEGVEIIKRMWTERSPTFDGKYFKIKEAYCEPKPVQKPRPRITIGGASDRILRVVAMQADQCNFGGNTLDWYEERLKVLRNHCRKAGRKFEEIEKSYVSLIANVYHDERDLVEGLRRSYAAEKREENFEEWMESSRQGEIGYGFTVQGRIAFAGTVPQIIERIAAYEKLAVYCFMLRFGDMPREDKMTQLFAAEIIPSLRKR